MASTNSAEFLRAIAAAEITQGSPGRQKLGQVGELLRLWQERRRYRSELRRLTKTGAHLVADIGLLPVHAAREARKPFWQA